MELLAPAGDLEKLETAYRFGADAAYIGLAGFSLRHGAETDEGGPDPAATLRRIKGDRRLYGALNIYFHNRDLRRLESEIESIATLPLDAIIVSDLGVLPMVRRYLPKIELHLSTQANCLNTEAARVYRDLGFSRIVPAREMSLDDLAELKETLPDLEVECFVHGAMCLAYSGRCLLSAWESGRSANKGSCAHSCRWGYRVAIEEAKRPGEYLPVEEHDGFTTILSPRDLCMIDSIDRMFAIGIDAAKIEGRMKSAYYVALVTRAYRKEIDRLRRGATRESIEEFITELWNVSHREYSTGFYLGDPDALLPAHGSYRQHYRYVARLEARSGAGRYRMAVKNSFTEGSKIEFVGPDTPRLPDPRFALYDPDGNRVERVTHHGGGFIEPSVPVEPGFLIRVPGAPTD